MSNARGGQPLTAATLRARARALKRTAYHEAGHAVMARRFGYIVSWVSIEPVGDLRGHAVIRHRVKPLVASGRVAWREVEAEGLIAMAGTAAGVVLVGSRRGANGEAMDMEHARRITKPVCHSEPGATALLAWLAARARAVLSLEAEWSAVRRIASMLLLNGELGGDTVERVVDRALKRSKGGS